MMVAVILVTFVNASTIACAQSCSGNGSNQMNNLDLRSSCLAVLLAAGVACSTHASGGFNDIIVDTDNSDIASTATQPAGDADRPTSEETRPIYSTPRELTSPIGGTLTTSPYQVEPESPWTFTLTPRAEHVFDSNAGSGPGRLSSTRTGLAFSGVYAYSPTIQASINVDHELTWYGFKGIPGFDPADGDPVDLAQRISLSPGVFVAINDDWGWFARTNFNLAFADDANITDSFTVGGLAGVRWRATENFSLTLGIAATTRLEDSGLISPVIGFEWNIDDRWTLGTDGSGLNLSYKVDDAWTAFGFARFERREYRIGASNSEIDNGIIRDQRVGIGAGVNWSPDRRFDVSLSGGVLVHQEIEFFNSSGTKVRDIDFDPAAFIALTGRIFF